MSLKCRLSTLIYGVLQKYGIYRFRIAVQKYFDGQFCGQLWSVTLVLQDKWSGQRVWSWWKILLCNLPSLCSSDSRRIINLSPVMVVPEEQPAQPALPIQPEGMRVICGHCGNTFLVCKPTGTINLTNHRVAVAWFCCRPVVYTLMME